MAYIHSSDSVPACPGQWPVLRLVGRRVGQPSRAKLYAAPLNSRGFNDTHTHTSSCYVSLSLTGPYTTFLWGLARRSKQTQAWAWGVCAFENKPSSPPLACAPWTYSRSTSKSPTEYFERIAISIKRAIGREAGKKRSQKNPTPTKIHPLAPVPPPLAWDWLNNVFTSQWA
jgi:hypothetical protein